MPKVNVRVHETHGRGTPASALARMARALEVGLVVVGTHGRRGVARALAGSIAERLVRMAPCPVLVVKPIAHAIGDAEANDDVEPVCEECAAKRAATNRKSDSRLRYWSAAGLAGSASANATAALSAPPPNTLRSPSTS